MDPLKRVAVFPSDAELKDILRRYPGWLTAIAEGITENPERPATEKELLVSHFQKAADKMGVYVQEGMPARRYIKGHFEFPSVEFLKEIRLIIDRRDATSFGVLNHMVAKAMNGKSVEDEVHDSLKYQKQLGISYFDAASLVRSFSFYAGGVYGITVPDPRKQPSALKTHLAIVRAVQTVQEIHPDAMWVIPKWGIQHSPASLSDAHPTMGICDPDLLSLVIEYADYIETVCRVMVERSLIKGSELRPLVNPIIDSLRDGAAPSLATGTL